MNADYTKLNLAQLLNDVRREGINLVASLRANSSIPYSIILSVIESCINIINSVTAYAQQVIVESVTSGKLESVDA